MENIMSLRLHNKSNPAAYLEISQDKHLSDKLIPTGK